MNMRPASALLLLLVAASSCGPPIPASNTGPVLAMTGPSRSMVSLFDTGAGIVVVDLGWWGAEDELRSTLRSMDADSGDVAAVLLTHAHRDHMVGWPAVRTATFYLAAEEEPYLFGEAEYEGWIPRVADRIHLPDHPRRGEIRVQSFDADTALVFGADTAYAFLVPGHTPGSTAYLVRGILFVGDAVTRTIWGGFRHARPLYSDDVDQARASLLSLFRRLEAHRVEQVCTAHARCAPYDQTFRRDALGDRSAGD